MNENFTLHDEEKLHNDVSIVKFNYKGKNFTATVIDFTQEAFRVSSISSEYPLSIEEQKEALDALKEESDDALDLRKQDLQSDAELEEKESNNSSEE